MKITQVDIESAKERMGYYWNNYTRKLRADQSFSTRVRRARALYVQALTRYYGLVRDYNEQEG